MYIDRTLTTGGTMRNEFCYWCNTPVRVSENFNPNTEKVFCCVGCRDAENLFMQKYGDEAINRRAHYRYLTQGGDDET